MIDVGSVEEFAEDQFTLVKVGKRDVGILRTGGEVYAVLNRCPHMGAPVCEGHVGPALNGVPGVIDAERKEFVLSCPWHHWEFRVDSGHSVFDPRERWRIRTYLAEIREGRVFVETSRVPASVTPATAS